MKDFKGLKRSVPPRLARGSADADIDAEMEAHLERLREELLGEGWTEEDATREAARRFGDARKLRAEVRHIDAPHERSLRRSAWWGGLRQDVRYWWRQLRRSPGHAVVTVLTLALGIGLTTSMFTVVNGVLLRPLPFPNPSALVALAVNRPDEAGLINVRDVYFDDIERSAESLEYVAAYMSYPPTTLTGAGDAARLTATWVTPEFFGVLGAAPAVGRDFEPSEHDPGADPAVVLGDALWRSRFGADPTVIGRTATLDGIRRRIVGVMPPGLAFPAGTDLWLPLEAHPLREEGLTFAYSVVARLGNGVSIEQARDELEALGRSAEWRVGSDDVVTRVLDLQDVIVGDSRYPLTIFSGAVALVLLIACTNVANLLLMRANAREHEIVVRKALGAGRTRLLRQLLTESVILACLGGALGIVVASAGVRALLSLAPPDAMPRGQELGIDMTVLGFTLATSVVAGIAFGLAPALTATRRELRETLADSGPRQVRGRRLGRSALVVAELGFAVVLLTGAGLLLRSFQQIRQIDLGFDPEGTLSFYVDLPQDDYVDTGVAMTLHERVLDGLARIPAVEVAGGANLEPFGPLSRSTVLTAEDGAQGRVPTRIMLASTGYFEAMRIRVISGRAFEPSDDSSVPRVAIVSRTLARNLWPGGDAVGRRLTWGRREWLTVVGVVEDIVTSDLTEQKEPILYTPLAQVADVRQLHHMSYVVRTAASARAIGATMREIVRDADPNLPVGAFSTMDQIVLGSMGERIFQGRVLGAFAGLALLLAAVGVYGVTAYSVSERTRELGIRVALGARRGQIALMTLRRALWLTASGLLIGGAVAVVATRLIAASLYGVTPADPLTYAAVALVLGGVTVVAALVPARRASRIDPVKALGV